MGPHQHPDRCRSDEQCRTARRRELLSGYKRIVGWGVAPANASYVRIIIRKYDTLAGNTDSYMFLARAGAWEVGANQSTIPPWSACDATVISGGFIRTELLTASNIQAGTLNAGVVSVVNLNADNIQAGLLNVSRLGDGAIAAVKLAAGAATDVSSGTGGSVASCSITCAGNDKILITAQAQAYLGFMTTCGGSEFSYSCPGESSTAAYIRVWSSSGSALVGQTFGATGGAWVTCPLGVTWVPGYGAGQVITFYVTCAGAAAVSIQAVCCRR